jgi:hypothetical protein
MEGRSVARGPEDAGRGMPAREPQLSSTLRARVPTQVASRGASGPPAAQHQLLGRLEALEALMGRVTLAIGGAGHEPAE